MNDKLSKRRFRDLVAFIPFLALLAGCGSGESEGKRQEVSIEQEGRPGFIGLSMASSVSERWAKDIKFFTERAQKLGGEVVLKMAEEDAKLQEEQCRQLVDEGARVLVIVPEDNKLAASIVDYAHSKNVKVIAYDRLINNSEVDLYVSFDNVRVGEIQARNILNKIPRGNFMILKGDPGDKNSELIYEGHMKALKPAIAKGQVKILSTKSVKNWNKSEAKKLAGAALDSYRLDAIIGSNDDIAAGVISALIERGLEGKIPVSGQDADLGACRYLIKGFQEVTVYKPIKKLAKLAAEQAIKALRGVTFDASNQRFKNGKTEIPTILLEPVTVTKWNLRETVIKDGFHTQEDVYEEPLDDEAVKESKPGMEGKNKKKKKST